MRIPQTLTPLELRGIIDREFKGELLPLIADSLQIDRVKLFNFKNENRQMWTEIKDQIIQSEISKLTYKDAAPSFSDKDNARITVVQWFLKRLTMIGTKGTPFKDFIIEHIMLTPQLAIYPGFKQLHPYYDAAEINSIDDAKEAVATYERNLGITLAESPDTHTAKEKYRNV